MLITLSGFFGSGGDELGRRLAEKLGYRTYDNELMEKAVAEVGIDMRTSTLAFYEETDESSYAKGDEAYRNALLSLQMDVLPIGSKDPEPTVKNYRSDVLSLYLDSAPISIQRRTIPVIYKKNEIDRLRFTLGKVVLDAAEKGNAVFFGRCSSHILGERADALRIFTYASLESCRERIKTRYGIIDDAKADELIQKTNMRRGIYFETFTGQKWDDLKNYDLCLNTDRLPLEESLEHILDLAAGKQP